ncbi:MAG: hypothetical protein MZV63_04155 [Marinilabiliales bacterium]|nr:hypothetical protein [Marinilabiliales bacterium]
MRSMMVDRLVKHLSAREITIEYIQKVVCEYYKIPCRPDAGQNEEKRNSTG